MHGDLFQLMKLISPGYKKTCISLNPLRSEDGMVVNNNGHQSPSLYHMLST